jgi:protoporphyrinogen oxidase
MQSRRDFLKTVILSSGSVYLASNIGCGDSIKKIEQPPVEKQFSLSGKPVLPNNLFYDLAHKYIREKEQFPASIDKTLTCDVVIVGAGPSGLMSAIQLRKLGYSVLVVENENRAGGAGVSSAYGDVRFPLASIYFTDYNEQVKEFCKFAGVEPVPAPSDAVYLEGNTYSDYWKDNIISELPISVNDKNALRKFRDDILKIKELPSYPLTTSSKELVHKYDSMSVREYLAPYKSDYLSSFINLYSKSSMGGSIDIANTYSFLNFYSSELDISENSTRFTFNGGLHGVTSKVAEKLGNESFLYKHLCVNITNTANGVEVHTMNREGEHILIKAKQSIVAIQKFMIPVLIPELPTEQKNQIRSLTYSPFLTVHICSSKPILNHNHFDTWYPSADPLFTDCINPQSAYQVKDNQDHFVTSVYCPRGDDDRGSLQSDEIIVSTCKKVVEKFTVLYGKEILDAIKEVQAFAWGHSVVVPTVGSHSSIAIGASASYKNIHFANTDNDSTPAFENALSHGVIASNKVHSYLNSNS